MKRSVKIFGVVAGMASLLVSCQKKEIVDNTPVAETVEISITAEVDEDTKTHLDGSKVKWDADEKLGVIEVATTKNNRTTLTKKDSSNGTVNDDGKISFPIKFDGLSNLEEVYYYSIYPNTALYSYAQDDKNNLTGITVNLDPEQKPTATSFGPKADLLVARPKCFKSQTSNITFNFARVIAVGKMKIKELEYPTGEGFNGLVNEPIYKVTIATDEAKISGKSTFGFKGISIDVPSEFGDSNEIVLDYDKGLEYSAANGAYAYFTAWPVTIKGGHTINITVETQHYTFKREIRLTNNLVFNTAQFTNFQVSFKGVEAKPKNLSSVLPKDDEKKDIKDLTVGNGASLLSVNNGSLISATATDEVEQSSVWNIVFNEKKNTYKISSLYPVKYVKAGETSLQLVDDAGEATEFSITKEGDAYYISKGNKYVSVNNNGVLFSTEKNSLNILAATVKHTINVQSSLILDAKAGKVEIPMTYFGFENVTCAANVDWISEFNAEKGLLTFYIDENENNQPRTAEITLSDGANVTKKITVTQRASSGRLLYATLDINDDMLQYFGNGWVTDEPFAYTQDNSASWEIKCGASKVCMEMSKPAEHYIKLPELANDIKSIKVFTTMGTKLIFESKDGTKKEAEINSNGVNEVETIVPFGENDVLPSVLKVASKTKITKIVVDARTPLATPGITAPTDGTSTLKWGTVTGAVSYDVTVGETKENVSGTSYEFNGEAGYYNVSVVALADPASLTNINSAAATATDVKFGTPTLKKPVLREGVVTETSITVVWDEVANAETYICKLVDTEKEVYTEKEVSVNNVTFNGLSSKHTYTVNVHAKGTELYKASSVATINVTTLNKTLVHTGSLADPYPVDEAKYLIDNGSNLTGKYVKGIVSNVSGLNEGKLTYTLKNDEDTNKPLTLTGNDLGDAAFSSVNDLETGSEVYVYYKDKDNTYLYSIDGHTSILTGIEIADEKTTEYNYGDTFIKPVVYGLYRGKDKEPLSEGLTFKIGSQTIGTESLGTYGSGNKTVTVSYEGVQDKDYSITVSDYYLHKFDGANTMKGSGGKGRTWYNTSGGIITTLYDCLNDSGTLQYVQTGHSTYAFESTITTSLIAQPINRLTISISNLNSDKNTLNIEGELLVADNPEFENAETIKFKEYNKNVISMYKEGKIIVNPKSGEVIFNLKNAGMKAANRYYRFNINADANNWYRITQISFEVK